MSDDRTRNEFIFRVLLFFILLLLLVIGAAIWLQLSTGSGVTAVMPEPAAEGQFLIDDRLTGGKPNPVHNLPVWMTVLIGGFTLMQMLCLLIAASIASHHITSARDRARIELLCETPMYLGLLGSLVGVCVTQFLAGTLAAPLAYMTTITGIILYLFGRFTIALSMTGSTTRIDQ